MVRFLSAALLLAAVSASATPAIPSFEFSVANIQASVAAMRAEQIQAKSGNLGAQISNLAWDLERYQRDVQRLRNDLRYLSQRLRRQGLSQPGLPSRPGQPNDPSLRWDVQRFTRDTDQLARDLQWRLNDLRFLSGQAQKDEALVAPANRSGGAARWLRSETNWFASDARSTSWDFRRAATPSRPWTSIGTRATSTTGRGI